MVRFIPFCLFILALLNCEISNAKNSLKHWMQAVPDSILISSINMPGSHDAGARYNGKHEKAQCQKLSISKQLKMGVRALDIRCRHQANAFKIYHRSVDQQINFEDVLSACEAFLKENPSECIIMSVKEEYVSEGCTQSFAETFQNYIQENPQLWFMENSFPRLGEVRGKIVVLQRFKSKGTMGIMAEHGWKDNAAFPIHQDLDLHIQDAYEVQTPLEKWQYLQAYLLKATQADNTSFYLHFASGYMPLENDTDIESVAAFVNGQLLQFFSEHQVEHMGIIMMDFVNKSLTKSLINTNF